MTIIKIVGKKRKSGTRSHHHLGLRTKGGNRLKNCFLLQFLAISWFGRRSMIKSWQKSPRLEWLKICQSEALTKNSSVLMVPTRKQVQVSSKQQWRRIEELHSQPELRALSRFIAFRRRSNIARHSGLQYPTRILTVQPQGKKAMWFAKNPLNLIKASVRVHRLPGLYFRLVPQIVRPRCCLFRTSWAINQLTWTTKRVHLSREYTAL